MNGYELSRAWFDWCFENPEKVNPNHTAIFFFAIEHCNRLGWRNKFGFPTQMAMDAIGIKKHQTYIRYFNDLVEWGFLKLVQKSTNQYSSNIISLVNDLPKNGKALDKAIINHAAKQTETIGQSNSSIDKPIEPTKPITNKTIPELQEILDYCKTLKEIDFYAYQNFIKLKYRSWVENGWRDGNDKPIKIWKTKILNAISYMPKEKNNGSNKEFNPHDRGELKQGQAAKTTWD